MKILKYIILLTIIGQFTCGYSQKATSKTVRFRLDTSYPVTIPDTTAPDLKILKPVISQGAIFRTESEQIDLVGEVKDENRIRFVSINKEVLVVNETGVFVTSLNLNNGVNTIQIKTMDEFNNIREQILTMEYNPPVITLADLIHKESTYYGLFIGIEEYRDRGLEDLENPINDAEALHKTLVKDYTFEQENIQILRNPKRADIIRELDLLRSKVTANDNLLIFYAGHGYYDEEAEVGYWFPADASRESTTNWFPNSTLVNHLKAIGSKHTLLITDACFAGSIFKSRSASLSQEVIYEKIYEIPSRKAMTSGTLTEVPDKSVFIKYLIQGLEENRQTYLSSEELFGSLRMAVISNSNVLPRYGDIQNVGNQGGDFIFLRKEQ